MLKHIIDPEVEEYEDVYDDDEYFAAQEMQQQEGALLKQGDEFKVSVWLTSIGVNLGIFCSIFEPPKGCIFSSAFLESTALLKCEFYVFQCFMECCF